MPDYTQGWLDKIFSYQFPQDRDGLRLADVPGSGFEENVKAAHKHANKASARTRGKVQVFGVTNALERLQDVLVANYGHQTLVHGKHIKRIWYDLVSNDGGGVDKPYNVAKLLKPALYAIEGAIDNAQCVGFYEASPCGTCTGEALRWLAAANQLIIEAVESHYADYLAA